MAMQPITSPANPRIKELTRLSRPAMRRQTGLFLLETTRQLTRALDAGCDLLELYVCDELLSDRSIVRRAAERDITPVPISQRVCEKLAYRQNPQGLIAVMRAVNRALEQLEPAGTPLLVVCSGLEKPGNLGAIIRSAEAAGAGALLIDDPDADLYNPNLIRASTGAVFSLPIIRDTTDRLMDWLGKHGVMLTAATPEADVPYTQVDLTGPTALVVGREDQGLDQAWRDAAGQQVSIPMVGRVDSLNVSVTAAVLLFEAARQRRYTCDSRE
jgi:TrmH family RNA methyltransferase